MRYNKSSHSVYSLQVHIVFVIKYRRKVLSSRILNYLESTFISECRAMDVELIEFEGESDHVHLLIGYNPRITVSKIVNQLKGVSSYRIRKLKPTEFQNKLWGDALWSPSYFACSCGGASLEKIKEYIRSQDRPD